MNYSELLQAKEKRVADVGFNVELSALNNGLFPFQKHCVQRALKAGRFAFFQDCGLGKGQPIGSKVITDSGWKNIEDLKIGDGIISSEGKFQKVTGVYPKGEINTYRFHYSDGVSCVFDEDHLHICRTNNDRQRGKDWRVMSTQELLNSNNIRYGEGGKSRNYDIPVVAPVQFTKKSLPLPPYLLGAFLGDGCLKRNIGFSGIDSDIINRVKNDLPLGVSLVKTGNSNACDYKIKTGLTGTVKHSFRKKFIDLGLYNKLSNAKFIPKEYLFSCVEDRLELLRGLMDTDGFIDKCGTCQFYSVSKQLADDVFTLVQSLGGVPTRSKKEPSYKKEGLVIKGQICHILTFSLTTFNPFHLKRKAERWKPNPRDNGRWIDRIEFETKQKTVCISVDSPNKSYVTENYIVTHNTFQQLEWARQVSHYTQKPVLVLCPLAVAGQTIQEGVKFGIDVLRYSDAVKYNDHFDGPGVYISNYEQLENIDATAFAGVVLDESSILKNFTGATKKLLIETFSETPYKLCCTATPSPNDLNEIGNHSDFLNILDAQDMRSKWFVRDEGMNNYRLKGHAKKDFYAWVSSWAIMLTNPKDIGFPMPGYDLPPLNFIEKQIATAQRENGKLFNDGAINATNFNAELRLTRLERLSEVADIVNNSDEQFLIWIKQNEEGAELKKLIPGAIEVTGSDSLEYKEKHLLGFANKEFRVLISKAKICQFGLNFQNCHNQVFASLDFSFESLYQSIRRSYRFGQQHAVNIYLITTDTMENVISSIKRKEKQFMEMQQEMNLNINSKQYGLLNSYEFKEYKTPEMWLMKGDTCIEIDRLEDNSLDLIVFSPPFSSLFTYSNYIHDMGNNESHEEFFKQYSYLLKRLYAKLKPGRLMCCHTKDLGVYANSSGYTGQYDFTGEHTKAVLNEGFKLHSKITIWTDPVLEMQRTKTQRLLYKTLTSDSSSTGIGMAEYITIFKKWEGDRENWTPITNITKKNFPLSEWQRWASPVWGEKIPIADLKEIQAMVSKIMDKGIDEIDLNEIKSHWVQSAWFDIKRTDVLNNKEGTAMGDEKHIAPLQLEVIHRLVNLWSNKGETVFTPFLGIGSEAYMALKNNRRAIGCELKDSYWDVAVKNCKKAVHTKNIPTLFAL